MNSLNEIPSEIVFLTLRQLRMLNDGFQPWFSNRKLFGLRSLNSRHLKTTEEGFAAINTLLQLNCRLLWWPAFLYCK
jgi:hypothetical protein